MTDFYRLKYKDEGGSFEVNYPLRVNAESSMEDHIVDMFEANRLGTIEIYKCVGPVDERELELITRFERKGRKSDI